MVQFFSAEHSMAELQGKKAAACFMAHERQEALHMHVSQVMHLQNESR
jgi:hypothetical protein